LFFHPAVGNPSHPALRVVGDSGVEFQQDVFCFFERKLDLFGFVGKLLTVYNMTRSCLKISSSSWEADKKSSQGALKLEVPKMPKMS